MLIESFGVNVEISFPENYEGIVRNILDSGLGRCYKLVQERNDRELLRTQLTEDGDNLCLFVDGEHIFTGEKEIVLSVLESTIRREIAVRSDKVFMHAGVVSWKGKAIVFPGFSNKGKTRLTIEFIRRGAEYYSDEYAVIDESGFVLPFPKFLSVRGIIDERRQVEIPVQELGGRIGKEPIRIGLVIITEYKPNAKWNPASLTKGQGLLEVISHVAPFSKNPENTLRVLEKALSTATILKSDRGEAVEVVETVLSSC